jgi:hypothetical protein
VKKEACVSKSSSVSAPSLLALAGLAGLLGLAYLADGWRLSATDLARAYQTGFAAAAVTLGGAEPGITTPQEQALLQRRLERARIVSAYDPEHLRAVPPFLLIDDGRFWPYAGDVHPRAEMRLRWDDGAGGELSITPYGGTPWKQPLRSKRLVRPDWSPVSNLVAFYDLGRVWIVDVSGRRMQSLVQEPLLDQGGVLRFSADGTALAFYFDADQRWKALDLYVLKE